MNNTLSKYQICQQYVIGLIEKSNWICVANALIVGLNLGQRISVPEEHVEKILQTLVLIESRYDSNSLDTFLVAVGLRNRHTRHVCPYIHRLFLRMVADFPINRLLSETCTNIIIDISGGQLTLVGSKFKVTGCWPYPRCPIEKFARDCILIQTFKSYESHLPSEYCVRTIRIGKKFRNVPLTHHGFYVLILLVTDNYMKPIKESEKRFFNITSKLPLELQSMLCHRLAHSGQWLIRAEDVNKTLPWALGMN
jgi:hypothetical protein